jgi:hypothetical protein
MVRRDRLLIWAIVPSATRSDDGGNIRAHTEVGFYTGVSAGGEGGRHQRRDGGGVASGHDRILVLTLAWSGSLLWLFVRLILALI